MHILVLTLNRWYSRLPTFDPFNDKPFSEASKEKGDMRRVILLSKSLHLNLRITLVVIKGQMQLKKIVFLK